MNALENNSNLVVLIILTVGFVGVMLQLLKRVRQTHDELHGVETSLDGVCEKVNAAAQRLRDSVCDCDIQALRNRVEEANRQLRDEIRLRNTDNAQSALRIETLEKRLSKAITETGKNW